MKKINATITVFALISFLTMGGFSAIAQDNQSSEAKKNTNGPKITFENTTHDYGTIYQGDNGECEFVFKNTGKEPLVLSNVQGCCGVSVLEWTKDPVMPKKTGSIKLRYYTSRPGTINREVTVTSNDPDNSIIKIKLVGKIEAKPAEDATGN